MGKFVYKSPLQNDTLLPKFDAGSLTLISVTKGTTALYTDKNGADIIVTGTNLVSSGGVTYNGTITGISFSNAIGQSLMDVTGLSMSAKTLSQFLGTNNIRSALDLISSRADTVIGTNFNDIFNNGSNGGNDTINGKGGDDTMFGSSGVDILYGGGGIDLLTFENTYDISTTTSGIVLSVGKGTVVDAWGKTDTISGFESYYGTKSNDTMTGGKGNETFAGLGGSDKIDGGGGVDTLDYRREAGHGGGGININFYPSGSDPNTGYARATDGFGNTDYFKNIERVIGTNGNDTFSTDFSPRTVVGLDGVDSIYAGVDTTVDFSGDFAENGVIANLKTGVITDDGFGNAENYTGVRSLIGSKFADDLTSGSNGGNINGSDGNDTIRSGGATMGANFTGGNGADTFIFTPTTISPTGFSESYEIKDYDQSAGDIIRFEGFGTVTYVSSTNFSGKGAEYTLIEADGKTEFVIDSDGNGAADFHIFVVGTGYDSGDFIFA